MLSKLWQRHLHTYPAQFPFLSTLVGAWTAFLSPLCICAELCDVFSTMVCLRTMGFVKQARHWDAVIGLLECMACTHLSVLTYSETVVGRIPDVLSDLENEHPVMPAVYRCLGRPWWCLGGSMNLRERMARMKSPTIRGFALFWKQNFALKENDSSPIVWVISNKWWALLFCFWVKLDSRALTSGETCNDFTASTLVPSQF